MREHVLFKTEDEDKPKSVCDRNGEVILSLCRFCNRAEIELIETPECDLRAIFGHKK